MINVNDNEAFVEWLYENAELATVLGLPGVLAEVMEHYTNEWIEFCEEYDEEEPEPERNLSDMLEYLLTLGYEEARIENLKIGTTIFIYSDVLEEVSQRTPGKVIELFLESATIEWADGLTRTYPIPMRWYNNCQLLVKEL